MKLNSNLLLFSFVVERIEKMIFQLVRMIILIGLVLIGFYFTHWLLGKGININRWIIGIVIFILVPLPFVFFPNMPKIISYPIFFICGILTIMFFELSRVKLEEMEEKFKPKG